MSKYGVFSGPEKSPYLVTFDAVEILDCEYTSQTTHTTTWQLKRPKSMMRQ